MSDLLTIELICSCVSGLTGALLTIVTNKRKETVVEGVLYSMSGIIFGAGFGTKWGGDDLAWSCVVALLAGSSVGFAIQGVQEHAPQAVKRIIDGWVVRLGGKEETPQPPAVAPEDLQNEDRSN